MTPVVRIVESIVKRPGAGCAHGIPIVVSQEDCEGIEKYLEMRFQGVPSIRIQNKFGNE